jgi:hypothetical protein
MSDILERLIGKEVLDEMDRTNRQFEIDAYRRKVAAAERERKAERDRVVVTEYTTPIPRHHQSEVFNSYIDQRIATAFEKLCRRDLEVAEEILEIVADGVRQERKLMRAEIDALRSQLDQLKAEVHKDRVIARGELTVLPPFIKNKSSDVA